MSQKKKRKGLSIEEKSHIIRRLENGDLNADIAKEFEVGHSTISGIWKNKDKIKALFDNNSLKIKRWRRSDHTLIEESLLTWVKHQRANNVPLSGPILQQKANDFARLAGNENFQCSSSWVQRFRVRYNIVTDGVTEEWLSHKLPALHEGYKPEEIYNADETGLFFNLTPDKIINFKGKNCKDGQSAKLRMTVLVAANMTGTRKEKLLVIGEAKEPCDYKNDSLPVMYEYNAKSWMTSTIFEKWLRNWDAHLISRGEKILLLVDNCPAHPVVTKLQCIKLVFLPPDVPSILQPMNQGVIKALKTQYRKLQVNEMLDNTENGENTKSINILDAILMISEAWKKVTQTVIANCFLHAGFKDLSVSLDEDDHYLIPLATMLQSPTNQDEGIPLAQLAARLSTESSEIEELFIIDNDVEVCAPVTEEDILSVIESNRLNTDEETEDQDETKNDQEQFQPVTLSQAINAVTILQKFITFNEEFNSDVNQKFLREMKHKMQNKLTNLCFKDKNEEPK